jgi:metal-sulfur cluster biosynthetic enzyme
MSLLAGSASTRERVLAALDGVIDPELDEPITSLRFLDACEVGPDGEVDVVLRLPTPQCAPNFAFLMAADARAAVRAVPGVRSVSVQLTGHYTEREINAALVSDAGFDGAFPGETDERDLGALRALFLRKALAARQARVAAELLGEGVSAERLTEATLAELPDTPDSRRCQVLRARLGLPSEDSSPAFVQADGAPLTPEALPRWLRMGRLIAMSLETNGGICRDLLARRYPDADEEEDPR